MADLYQALILHLCMVMVSFNVHLAPHAVGFVKPTGKGLALFVHPVGVLPSSARQNEHLGVVHSPIRLMSLDIFIPIFECSYEEYDYEGDDDKAGGDGGELWDELKNYDEGEETLNKQ